MSCSPRSSRSVLRAAKHFLDLDSSFPAGHKNRFLLTSVDHNSQVKLPLDIEALFDQDTLDHSSFGSRLWRHQFGSN